MTTFGHRIAAACDDGTVGIYDSVTGVLRLSLSPPDPVQAIRGSPDGSILFCTHQGPSITLWDIQTGGMIHTFVLERKVEDIAVSSKGRYLACGLSDGFVKIWEIANKMEGAAIGSGSPATHLCWVEPEERLVVAGGIGAHMGRCFWKGPAQFRNAGSRLWRGLFPETQ
jgi:WD40 repeat protein